MGPEDGGSGNSQGPQQQAWRQERARRLRNCNQALVHASQCNNAGCSVSYCQVMKKMVLHTHVCKRRVGGGCPMCRQLIALCRFHVRNCQGDACQVPFCRNAKHKLQQQQA